MVEMRKIEAFLAVAEELHYGQGADLFVEDVRTFFRPVH